MKKTSLAALSFIISQLSSIPATAQVSPDINYSTNKVTLRLKAPNAQKVKVTGGFSGDMTKNAEGVWEATFSLGSDLKCYQFDVDGAIVTDPHNINLTHDGSKFMSYVATRPEFRVNDIPHGSVHEVWMPGTGFGYSQRRVLVYTPPGYETSTRRYPVLYVLHGWYNDEDSWFDYGRAPYIMDYLISTGEAEPMIVVSPNLMAGDEAAPGRGHEIYDQDAQRRRNGKGGTFENTLTDDIVPFVEAAYRVYTDKYHRGICGLSHGGGITMQMVCNKPQWFGEVGLFSAANLQKFYENDRWTPNIKESYQQPPRNFYFACGTGDSGQYPHMQKLDEKFTALGLAHETYWSGGGHNWGNWREYLIRFAKKIFKDGSGLATIEAETCDLQGEAAVQKDLQASGGSTVTGLGYGNWLTATHQTPIPGQYPGAKAQDDEMISIQGEWEYTIGDKIIQITDNGPVRMLPAFYDGYCTFPGTITIDTTREKRQLPKDLSTRAVWYRKRVYVPKSFKNKRITLFLERPYTETNLYVNGLETGQQQSLSAPHRYDVSKQVIPGERNEIVIRVCNGLDSLARNGITGRMELQALDKSKQVSIKKVKIGSSSTRSLTVNVELDNHTKEISNYDYWVLASLSPIEDGKVASTRKVLGQILCNTRKRVSMRIDINRKLVGDNVYLYSEDHPQLFLLTVEAGNEVYTCRVGIRRLDHKDGKLLLNNNPLELRQAPDTCLFDVATGAPSTDKAAWKHLFSQLKQEPGKRYNALTFRRYCPPEAAFEAADEVGFYLFPGVPSWPAGGLELEGGKPESEFEKEEWDRIVDEYGNHPSFFLNRPATL